MLSDLVTSGLLQVYIQSDVYLEMLHSCLNYWTNFILDISFFLYPALCPHHPGQIFTKAWTASVWDSQVFFVWCLPLVVLNRSCSRTKLSGFLRDSMQLRWSQKIWNRAAWSDTRNLPRLVPSRKAPVHQATTAWCLPQMWKLKTQVCLWSLFLLCNVGLQKEENHLYLYSSK